MKTIYKYQLEIRTEQKITLIKNALILSCKNQRGVLTMWALCDKEEERLEERSIVIVGTGHQMQPYINPIFIDTVLIDDFVWHIFELQ